VHRRDELKQAYGIAVSADNAKAVSSADVVVLSVKPQILERVLQDISSSVRSDALVISIAAGVPIVAIERHLAPHIAVCRTMPNTPALVGAGATAMSPGRHCDGAHLQLAHTIFSAVGEVVDVDESLMDAVTGLSGSGPAYVFLIIEALADAGVQVGLPRNKAMLLAAQTVHGASKLLLDSGEHPSVLKDRVTSPGGTAIAGLHTLEEGGLRHTLMNAVSAATARSEELGRKYTHE
jgi:pyrroline-5-carboxylate reductase